MLFTESRSTDVVQQQQKNHTYKNVLEITKPQNYVE